MRNAFIMLGLSVSSLLLAKSKQEEPKKIVFIAVDDLNDWVGFLGGHPNAKTPNMDRLAAMGMVFENAYCAAPVSNASRTALLTGIGSPSSGVYGNAEFLRESDRLKDIVTLPKYFSEHGYRSMVRGKVFHHPMGPWSDPQSWDDQADCGGKNMSPKKQKGRQANGLISDTTGGSVMLDWAGVDVDEKQTNDYLNCEWAAEQIMKPAEDNMFIACGVFRPHLPWYVPQKYFDRFPLEEIQDPLYNEADVLDLPARALQMTGYEKLDHEYNILKGAGRLKEAVRAYLACISYADDCLAPLVDALENNPDKENTIVVFWGDHGWHLGEKMRYRKFSLWERSCRVPLIVVAPGITGNKERCVQPVSLLDLYPTLVELADLPTNKHNQGHSFVKQLENPKSKRSIPAITTLGQNEHSLRSSEYRYIIYRDGSEELYNHQIDPDEWVNLADNPDYEKVIKKFKKYIPKENVKSIGNSTISKK